MEAVVEAAKLAHAYEPPDDHAPPVTADETTIWMDGTGDPAGITDDWERSWADDALCLPDIRGGAASRFFVDCTGDCRGASPGRHSRYIAIPGTYRCA